MRAILLVMATLVILCYSRGIAQTYEPLPTNQLIAELNKKVAPQIEFTFEKDSGAILLFKVKQNIGINKSLKKGSFFESLSKKPGPYGGPIYWIYDFEKISTSKATFQQDSTGIIQLQLYITTPDTLIINVKKNAHSCVTRPIDVYPHKIIWSGEKSLRIDFIPSKEMNQINLKIQHVAIQGILKRADTFDMSKYFRKDLEEAFKKGFLPVFQHPEFVTTLNEIMLS